MAFVNAHFYSEILGQNVTCAVILPEKVRIGEKRKKNAPVLWLLHGGSDDQTMWQRNTSIERYLAPLGMAAVMPFAEFSGYRNQSHGSGNYYGYMTEELPLVMHEMFGLSMAREDNFICGPSMGGNGSLKFAMANPEKYAAVGCMSAGFFDHDVPADGRNLDPIKDKTMWTRFDGREIAGSEDDLLENARKIIREGKPVPRVYHTCGSEDHIRRIAHKTRDFFENFKGNPFDYVYEEDPGRHTWEYWDEHVQKFLQYIQKA